MKNIIIILLAVISCLSTTTYAQTCKTDSIQSSTSHLLDNGDGTISDSKTGLMWQKCSLGQSGTDCTGGSATTFNWQSALIAAESNTDYAHSDWRLPNMSELKSIFEVACVSPSINATIFPNTISNWYWSSSPYAGNNGYAWVVYFYAGYSNYYHKGNHYYVRLVRSGQ